MSHDNLSPSFVGAFVAHLVQEKNTLLAVTSTGFGPKRQDTAAIAPKSITVAVVFMQAATAISPALASFGNTPVKHWGGRAARPFDWRGRRARKHRLNDTDDHLG
ncbi:MAG: hypothetical protein ACU0BH_01655 [Paracoccaceae bacterium]|nr:hypothetical protein [Seohaeicola saemankumensis]